MAKKEKPEISKSLKSNILNHIKKDSKEFKSQLKEDKELKKTLKKTKNT